MNNDAIKLESQLCHRFYTVSNAFTRAYRPLLKTLDVTYPQYIVLMALWEKDDITISELLALTKIDGGAMSLILKKLCAKGFLVVSPCAEDKRVKMIALTDHGRASKNCAYGVADTMMCSLKNLSLEEARQLMSLIDKLSEDLTQAVCEPKTA